ncbi:hypothetical protein SLE2022_391120 [Rubroshorea leprosula]
MVSTTTSTWMLSLKVLFISTGVLSLALGLKVSVPLVLEFCVSQAPVIWSSVVSLLRPPYLYVIINGIIITIVASSRLHHHRDEDNEKAEQITVRKTAVDPHPAFEFEVKSSGSDFGALEPSMVVFEQKQRDVVEAGGFVEEKNAVVEDHNGDGENELDILKSTWNNPPLRMDSSEIPVEIDLPAEKPLVSARFSHRKPVNKASSEGGHALRVAKPRRHETMENTWKMIMEKKAMPLSRHLKKSETFKDTQQNHQVEVDPLAEPSPVVKKSETFKDRTNFQMSPTSLTLRKEPSLSQDELNRRVEAFIKKFNEEMRLQRLESINQYNEMINRGSH